MKPLQIRLSNLASNPVILSENILPHYKLPTIERFSIFRITQIYNTIDPASLKCLQYNCMHV